MKCGRTVEELEEEITRLRSLWSGDMHAVIQLQKRVTELEAAIARQDHGQPDGSEWCAWNERRWKECTPENCIWLKCSTSP